MNVTFTKVPSGTSTWLSTKDPPDMTRGSNLGASKTKLNYRDILLKVNLHQNLINPPAPELYTAGSLYSIIFVVVNSRNEYFVNCNC